MLPVSGSPFEELDAFPSPSPLNDVEGTLWDECRRAAFRQNVIEGDHLRRRSRTKRSAERKGRSWINSHRSEGPKRACGWVDPWGAVASRSAEDAVEKEEAVEERKAKPHASRAQPARAWRDVGRKPNRPSYFHRPRGLTLPRRQLTWPSQPDSRNSAPRPPQSPPQAPWRLPLRQRAHTSSPTSTAPATQPPREGAGGARGPPWLAARSQPCDAQWRGSSQGERGRGRADATGTRASRGAPGGCRGRRGGRRGAR